MTHLPMITPTVHASRRIRDTINPSADNTTSVFKPFLLQSVQIVKIVRPVRSVKNGISPRRDLCQTRSRMIDIQNKFVSRKWEACPRDAKEARWSVPYATLNAQGDIVLSRATHEAMGSPEAYILLFDRERDTIGLRPARHAEKNAYPARPRGKHGGRRIRGYRLIREFGVAIFETVRFHRCMKDRDGTLILDTRDTVPVKNK
jgi:hypothetical protein